MRAERFRWLLAALLLGWGIAPAQSAAPAPFILLDAGKMAAYKAAYIKGQPVEVAQVKAVLRAADKALRQRAYFITGKSQVPPTGDKHDYMSQAPYSWPDPTRPDGLPYINKDGLRNPEAAAFTDEDNLKDLFRDVKTLGVAYYFTGNEQYAACAAKQLRGFFLEPATRMNPHLNFAQAIPGVSTGRCYGMIESRDMVEIPDALALFSGSKSIDARLVGGLKDWFRQFTTWATTSKLGLEEGRTRNNHSTFYDAQVIDFALFTGDETLARKVLETMTLARLAVQLAPDGSQPLELARTRPWNYVTMNMLGWVRVARLAEKLKVDLWNYTLPDGRGLHPAIAWFKPYLLRQKQMDRPDVVPVSNHAVLTLYHLASPHYADLEAEKVFALNPDFARVPWAL
ncbi:hypothetical protein BEN47_12100 [Hymenobacter lapidarius]|uniref:Alginate lyase domain-containing protein n=1 Tax=Hymenobacter lapidarius TaxID=1908237 RepID=A0A1G1T857_9BACT|nr:alginate lyase family protein [Hymenobacter lapidarius]OGX87046.1 hypothetical protein BEN47_12100 [Hymenobacter lapidarius]